MRIVNFIQLRLHKCLRESRDWTFLFRGKFLIDYVMPQIQFSNNVLTEFCEPNSHPLQLRSLSYSFPIPLSTWPWVVQKVQRMISFLFSWLQSSSKTMIFDFNEGKTDEFTNSNSWGVKIIFRLKVLSSKFLVCLKISFQMKAFNWNKKWQPMPELWQAR